ncbi:putative chromatin remodeler Bromodomain family [Helianthus anomalus]
MTQIVKRKRRGRPSNIDRARRNSQLAPPSPPDRRSTRRRRNVRYNFDIDDYVDDDEFYDDEDEDVGRREKKIRLLLFDDDRRVSHAPSSSSSEEDDDDDEVYTRKRLKKRKLDDEVEVEEVRGRKFDDEDEENEEGEEEGEAGGSDFDCGTASDVPKRVPMPDKKTLELILDKLQKKDIYGVYAEPVDPEELPDYHDVIKHPMDFATIRKKLAKGLYLSLKEFESDVFLICTNAMQYNAPDTVYYKQASSIQELAKLKFQRLRDNTDPSEKELNTDHKTTPSFSMPKKQLKKSVARTAPDPDPIGTETFSDATVRTEEFPNGSSAQTPARQNSGDVPIAENSSLGDSNLDKDQELVTGKGCMPKLGRKPSVHDENRRETYNISLEPVPDSDSVLSTFEGESKQFIPVGLHVDHSYARSLARFAATLGPVAWKIASHTIEQALPEGVKFGPGWVGEYEPLPTPVLVPENRIFKEPNFLAHFKITSDVKDNKKASQTPKIHVDLKEVNDGFNPAIHVKRESPREPRKDSSPSPRVPFFAGSNPVHQNSQSRNFTRPQNTGLPRVELNHPPPLHVNSAADFVAKRPITNASDVPSKPVSRNGNLASLGSLKHPSSNNDGFAPGRPSKPVGLDCNRMVPMDSNITNITPRRDQQGLSDPVQMMKMLGQDSQQQQNGNGFGFVSKRDDSNNVALTAAQAWMSLGGTATTTTTTTTGGFVKPPLHENRNPHKQQISADSLYNPARDRPQPQVTRFRGEFNTYQQPVRPVNDGQLQNKYAGFPQMMTAADLSRFQVQSAGWRGVPPQMQQQPRPRQESRPPDLNIGYQSIGSPVRQSTGMLVDSQQPDLALQL